MVLTLTHVVWYTPNPNLFYIHAITRNISPARTQGCDLWHLLIHHRDRRGSGCHPAAFMASLQYSFFILVIWVCPHSPVSVQEKPFKNKQKQVLSWKVLKIKEKKPHDSTEPEIKEHELGSSSNLVIPCHFLLRAKASYQTSKKPGNVRCSTDNDTLILLTPKQWLKYTTLLWLMQSNAVVMVTKVNMSEMSQIFQHQIMWKNPNIKKKQNRKYHLWHIFVFLFTDN